MKEIQPRNFNEKKAVSLIGATILLALLALNTASSCEQEQRNPIPSSSTTTTHIPAYPPFDYPWYYPILIPH